MELRQLLVHTIRKVRPVRLVFGLDVVSALGPVSVGTLAAACTIGDHCQIAVFIDNATRLICAQLRSAGVSRQRLR